MRKYIFLICSLVAHSVFAQCDSLRYTKPVFSNVTKAAQIKFGTAPPYGIITSQDLYLDFYEPLGDTLKQRPLIVYAFGGGYLIGDKNQPPIPDYCQYYAKCGYAVAAIDYRIGFNTVSTESVERAVYRGVQDVNAAVRFLCQRNSTYKIDTNAIFLTGSSAGCFSGLHMSFMNESQRPASTHGILLEPAEMGCFNCSGNNDNNNYMPKPKGLINHWGAILDTNFIENNSRENIPVISFHGDNDNLVPYVTGNPFSYPVFPVVHGSKPIHRRLTNIGIKNKLVPLVGEGHEPWLLNTSLLDTAYKYTLPFLYEVMQPQKPAIAGNTTVCLNEPTTYTVPYTAGSTYCWTANGATILSQNLNTITVKWASIGSKSISVKEKNKNDYVSETGLKNITVVDRPVPNFSATANELTVTIQNSATNTTSYQYYMGNGAILSTASPTYTYAAPGTYHIIQAASNGFCSDTIGQTITIDTCPAPFFTYSISNNNTVNFTANPSNGVQYYYVFGDGDSATQTLNTSHTYAVGSYLVGLWMTNAQGCKKAFSQIITISPNGINDFAAKNSLLFPNPFSNEINYAGEKCHATLLSIEGKEIATTNDFKQFSTAHLAKGIYFIKMKFADNTVLVRKIVKE